MLALRAFRSSLFLAGAFVAWPLGAQSPTAPIAATITDEDEAVELVTQEEPTDQPPARETPQEIPETVVPGRPGVFPANPLEDDTTITPTRTETRIGQTGTALTVITREEIVNSGQQSVAEVLRGKTGLDVVRSGGPGGQTSIFLRGANSQQTKVLLDGVPLNDPSSATRGFDFSTLDVENIERIEVLRGPQSLLYGSDAIGGVVNIITERGDGPPTARAMGMGGSLGTYRTGASVSGGSDVAYYSLAGSYFGTDGISSASKFNGNREKDGYKNGTLSGRFGYTPSELVNIDYVFRYTDAEAEVDDIDFFGTGLPIDNLIRKNLLNSFANRVQLQSLFVDGGIEQVIAFGLTDYHRFDTDTGSPFVPPVFDGQSRTLDGQWNFLVTETNTFSVGAQYYAEDAISSLNPLVSQYNRGVFVQDQWQILENWYASFGARWDDHSRAGPAETYRATTNYTLPTNTDIHASIGTGFRAPALAENLFAFGNPNLLPEQSKGWDIGATQRLFDDRVSFDATYFRNDFDNLIVFDFTSFTLENIGRSRASGVELSGEWLPLEDTRLYANYTFTDTLDLATGLPLLRRPRDKVMVGVDQYFFCRQARLGAAMLYVGDRLDTRNTMLDQYTLVNFNGSLYLNERAELFARIDNAFNERYEEVLGFGTVGIAGYAGVNLIW